MNVDEVLFANFFKQDQALKKINFTIFGYRIQGEKYDRLWYHLLGRKITVNRRISDFGFSEAEAAGAAYFMISNNFSIGGQFDATGEYGKTFMAHEGAHALIDLQNLGAVDRGRSEAVAYLAEAIWRKESGLGPLKAARNSRTANASGFEPMRDLAFAMAGALAGTNGSVPDADADKLAEAIRNHPTYTDPKPHISDGIG